VLRALAKDPNERFASVQEFAQALEEANWSQPKLLNSPPQIKSSSNEKNRPYPPTEPALSAEQLSQLHGQLQADPPLSSYNPTGYETAPTPRSTRPGRSSSPFRGFLASVLTVLAVTAQLIVTLAEAVYELFRQQVVPWTKRFIRQVSVWFQQQVIPFFKSLASRTHGQIQQQGQPSTITSYAVSPDLLPNPSTVQFTESALPAGELKDFFISYNRKDEKKAEWIAWKLEEAKYSTIMPKWDFRPGTDFEMEMRKARAKTKRTIVILSPDYLKARNSMAEWSLVFQQHTTGGQDMLLPVCVRDCGPKLKRLLGSMVYIDLVGIDPPTAQEILLAHVRGERIKPKAEPEYVVHPKTEPSNLTDILFATLRLPNAVKPKDTNNPIPSTPVTNQVPVFTQQNNAQQSTSDTPNEPVFQPQTPITEKRVKQPLEAKTGVPQPPRYTRPPEDTEPPVKGIEIFFSYSHKDEELRDELENHLSTLKQLKLITAWHDKEIGAGKDWAHEINTRISKACIILLLVSPHFIASRYCFSVEMVKAMERHEAGEARVIPILIRPVDWEGVPFDKLQMLPKGAKAVTSWSNRDEAFADIAKSIRRAVNELNTNIPNQ
jgi:hypothetical protein